MRALLGMVVVAGSLFFSVASSHDDDGSVCGALFQDGQAEGGTCSARGDCNEVCCLCDDGDRGFIAQGCNLDEGVCYGGDSVCQLALDDDPTLCDGSGGDGGTE